MVLDTLHLGSESEMMWLGRVFRREGKTEPTSVHVVVLVFLLPLTVAGFADSNTTFAHFITARTPHVNGVID